MTDSWRQQQENEERRWYEEGPGSSVWKRHMRLLAELRERMAEERKRNRFRRVRFDNDPF